MRLRWAEEVVDAAGGSAVESQGGRRRTSTAAAAGEAGGVAADADGAAAASRTASSSVRRSVLELDSVPEVPEGRAHAKRGMPRAACECPATFLVWMAPDAVCVW